MSEVAEDVRPRTETDVSMQPVSALLGSLVVIRDLHELQGQVHDSESFTNLSF